MDLIFEACYKIMNILAVASALNDNDSRYVYKFEIFKN